MADSGNGGSWWGGWIQTAKEKSASAIEFVKKDLAEFTTVVQQDTSKAASQVKSKIAQETASSAGQKVKAGVNNLIGGISRALVVEAEGEEDKISVKTPSSHIFNKAQARLHAIQVDPGTYLNQPTGAPEKFETWKAGFDIEEQKGNISELLVVNVEVRSLYTQLVPGQVSHAEYWQRYYYKCHQLEEDEARKNALKRRADVASQEAELEWDEDEWGDVAGPASPPAPGGMELAAAALQQKDSTGSTETNPTGQSSEQAQHSKTEIEASQDAIKQTLAVVTDTVIKEHELENTTTNSPVDIKIDSACEDAEKVLSPTETLSTTDSDFGGLNSPQSSIETLTVVSGESSPPSSSLQSPPEELEISPDVQETDVKTREKGDLVVVGSGSDRTTPSSDSASSHNKESTDDDWEKDFDIEVTEEDIKLAKEGTKSLTFGTGDDGDDDDWENWE